MSPCDFSNRKYHMNTMGLFPALHAALCLPTSIHLYIPLLSSYFPIPSLPPSRFCDICAPSPLFFHFTILLFFLSCCVGGEKEGRGTGAGAEAEAGACPCIYTLCSPHKQRGTCSRCRRCRRQRWPHRCCSGDHSSGSRAGSWQGDKQQIKSRASINISFLGRCEAGRRGREGVGGEKSGRLRRIQRFSSYFHLPFFSLYSSACYCLFHLPLTVPDGLFSSSAWLL